MLQASAAYLPEVVMTEATRKKIRLRAAAKLIGLDPSYLSRVAKEGRLAKEGVAIIRNPEYPDVVEFYEDEILEWFATHHTKRARKKN